MPVPKPDFFKVSVSFILPRKYDGVVKLTPFIVGYSTIAEGWTFRITPRQLRPRLCRGFTTI